MNQSKSYSVPLETFSYEERDDDLKTVYSAESLYVNQGFARISDGKIALRSDGFSFCSGRIIRNRSTLESALFHVDQWALNNQQKDLVEQLVENYITSLNLQYKEKEELLSCIYAIRRGNCPSKYGLMDREKFQLRMEQLNENGVLEAKFIYGDISITNGPIIFRDFLSYLGMHDLGALLVSTECAHWGLLYDAQHAKVFVNAKKHKKIFRYDFS